VAVHENEIRAALAKYKFYHVIKLTDSISTPGWTDPGTLDIVNMVLKALRSRPLQGLRVLDVGCRDGLFSFEAEQLGAREVIGIDNDLSPGAVEFLIPFFQSKIQMESLNLYDLTPHKHGLFDVVCFAGVLYHLRYPFWGLRCIREVLKPGGHLIIHTAIYVDDNRHAILFCPIGDECPGDDPTHCTNFNLKGLVDTLYSLGLTVESVEYLWEHGLVDHGLPGTVSHSPGGMRSWFRRLTGGGRAGNNQPVNLTKQSFDEKFYLDRHPDLREAIEKKRWTRSGFMHYQFHGRAEGRWARRTDGTDHHSGNAR
jgi:SAM-dependent methyltransferase